MELDLLKPINPGARRWGSLVLVCWCNYDGYTHTYGPAEFTVDGGWRLATALKCLTHNMFMGYAFM